MNISVDQQIRLEKNVALAERSIRKAKSILASLKIGEALTDEDRRIIVARLYEAKLFADYTVELLEQDNGNN